MLPRSRFLIFCSAAFLFAGACSVSQALTIDWDTVSWTNGSLINSLDVDPSRPGNDATVTVSGDTGLLEPERPRQIRRRRLLREPSMAVLTQGKGRFLSPSISPIKVRPSL